MADTCAWSRRAHLNSITAWQSFVGNVLAAEGRVHKLSVCICTLLVLIQATSPVNVCLRVTREVRVCEFETIAAVA